MADRLEPSEEEKSKFAAEARKANAEARKFEAEADVAEMERKAKQLVMDIMYANDSHYRVYRFDMSVSDKSVEACINELSVWSRLDPGCDMKIIFNSPGGDVVNGMALFDFLIDLRSKGHTLTTVSQGYAASMAGILLQAGDVRQVGRESWILIHEISAGMMGSYGELSDRLKWVEKVQERVLRIFAERSTLSIDELRVKWLRTDWWISSDEALELGIVDEVV